MTSIPPGATARREPFEQTRLFVRREIVQEIEESDVAGRSDRLGDILLEELEIVVCALRHRPRALDLPPVTVESADRSEEIALP